MTGGLRDTENHVILLLKCPKNKNCILRELPVALGVYMPQTPQSKSSFPVILSGQSTFYDQ